VTVRVHYKNSAVYKLTAVVLPTILYAWQHWSRKSKLRSHDKSLSLLSIRKLSKHNTWIEVREIIIHTSVSH